MTKPRVPRDLLDPVIDYFKPQRVILFGSRARGEATRVGRTIGYPRMLKTAPAQRPWMRLAGRSAKRVQSA